MAKGLLLVLSGPGGVGKTSLMMEWRRRDPSLRYTTSVTTRSPRPKAEQYEHVGEDEFRELVEAGEFVQWINPPGLEFYGTLRAPIDAALPKARTWSSTTAPRATSTSAGHTRTTSSASS